MASYQIMVNVGGNPLFSTEPLDHSQAVAAYRHLSGRFPITDDYTVRVLKTEDRVTDVTAVFIAGR